MGWALGDGQEHGDDPAWDAVEADALYDLLEREVIPGFYARDGSGIPAAWVKRMRESMAQLTPRFSANRTVREYTNSTYLPAAAAYRERAANKGAIGAQMVEMAAKTRTEMGLADFVEVKVQIRLASSTTLRRRSFSLILIRRWCGSSFMPMESTTARRCGRK